MQVADFIKQIDIIGHKMFVDVIDTLYFKDNQSFEPYETSIMENSIEDGEIFVDIGANIGYYTLLAARKVGKKGKVYAFEPDTKNFQLLKTNIELNAYDNVILEKKAISNITGKAPLFKSIESSTDHSLYKTALLYNIENEIVDTITLDDYMGENKDKINFIKMDIQGSEWNALQGMTEILKNDDLIIFMEFWKKGFLIAEVNPRNVIDLLLGNGFNLFEIREEERRIISLDNNDFIDAMIKDQCPQKNLICIKGAKK